MTKNKYPHKCAFCDCQLYLENRTYMNVIDIRDLFEGVYDCDALTEDQWNEANSSFEEECNQAVIDYIDENRKNIIFEWASKLGLKKFPKLEATK